MINAIKNAIELYIAQIEIGFMDECANAMLTMKNFDNLTQSQVDVFCTICDCVDDKNIQIGDETYYAINDIIAQYD